jgi:hypothetical protein
MFRIGRCLPLIFIVATAWADECAFPGAEARDVLTQHNDNCRTGVYPSESQLTLDNVKASSFGKIWTLFADGLIVAQPLYVSNLKFTKCPGGCNGVIFATMRNTVYAYMADRKPSSANDTLLWAKYLGPGRPADRIMDLWRTNAPEFGILSTPVIDRVSGEIYVVSLNVKPFTRYGYFIHALDLASGKEKRIQEISGIVPTLEGKGQSLQFSADGHAQRPALLLSQGLLYIAFGASGEGIRRYHGWLFAYDARNFTRKAVWCATPSSQANASQGAGIWMAGQGPAADGQGNVYVVSGNGIFNVNARNTETRSANRFYGDFYGDSFVKLWPQLTVADYFTPCDQSLLAGRQDLDMGSSGAVLIPNSQFLVGGGKQGLLYVLDRNNMGHFQNSSPDPDCQNTQIIQQVQATHAHVHEMNSGGHIHGSPIFWVRPNGNPRLYVWGEMDYLRAFNWVNNKLTAAETSTYQLNCVAIEGHPCMPGGMLSLSWNSSAPQSQSGILWALAPLNGDANRSRGVAGMLMAFDASNVGRELWRSENSDPNDRVGMFAKFAPPTIAGGKVFVPTYGDRAGTPPHYQDIHYFLGVYGLKN